MSSIGFGDLSFNLVPDFGVSGRTLRKSKTVLSRFFGVWIGSMPKYWSTADQFGLGTASGDELKCAGISFSTFKFSMSGGHLKSL